MKPIVWTGILALAAVLGSPGATSARGLSVELWTDRGTDAVYQPGENIGIKARTSDDAFLLVYEIDAEGAVHVLFPVRGQSGRIEGRHTYRLPDDDRGELVVDATTGEGYIVAIASDAPFDDLPWYLRPYDPQGEDMGYVDRPDPEEGISEDGRIVGDPFVAMERIRRRVVREDRDGDAFATAYTSYYVHERVRYPRYICNDCHRPGLYNWWTGFDPYYTTCSVFDFRVNWSWGWGPRYWFGSVPYFVYVYRDDCPPAYRRYSGRGTWYSSWDGWNRWCDLWGSGGLRRYKSAPPPGYTPPAKWETARSPRELPPGFLAGSVEKRGVRSGIGLGAGHGVSGDERGTGRERRDGGGDPVRESRPDDRTLGTGRTFRGAPGVSGGGDRPSDPAPPRFGRSRDEGSDRRDLPPPAPRREERAPERPRQEVSPPRQEERRNDPPREVRAPDPPRQERAPAPAPPPKPDPPKGGSDSGKRGDDGGGGRRHR